MSDLQEHTESTRLVIFSDLFGCLQVSLGLQSTFLVAHHGTLVELVSCNRVEHTNAPNIEAHEEGHIVVDSNVNNDQVVDNMPIRSHNVEHGPVVNPLVDHKWSCVSDVLVNVEQVQVTVRLIRVEFLGRFLIVSQVLEYLIIVCNVSCSVVTFDAFVFIKHVSGILYH